ncbi:MAG: hypothetical protein CL920_29650 [Deltaproteobacteria bacterium]|nr:hypothetical protein [Deltaproteobacteria bacterium]MBU52878.1 hypothetical protein [Deltaproteobacteria bacterium]
MKKNTSNRWVPLLSALSIVFSAFLFNCGDNNNKGEGNNTEQIATEKAAEKATEEKKEADAGPTEKEPADEPKACATGEVDCNGTCTNTSADDKNCGSCGTACATGETCKAGKCESSSTCSNGETDCSGTCTDTQTDDKNCGSCGTACATGETCKAGKCESSNTCSNGETDCSGTCTDTQTDDKNCGSCGNVCTANQTCKAGKCEDNAVTCGTGETDCSGTCVKTDSDVNNCGSCGNACASGESCNAGKCEAPSKCGPTTISFSTDVYPILNASCSCHQSGTGGLKFGNVSETFTNLAGHITAGDPDTSNLIKRMESSASPMPPSGKIGQTDIDKIRNWICQGAKNN